MNSINEYSYMFYKAFLNRNLDYPLIEQVDLITKHIWLSQGVLMIV